MLFFFVAFYMLTVVLLLTDISVKNKLFCFSIIFDENDVEMFGIMVGQNFSTQYAL